MCKSLLEFSEDLLNKLTSRVALKNTKLLLTKLLCYGSCKLYKLAEDKNEYKRLKRTLSKENKLGHLDETLVNDVLMGEALKQLS